MNSKQTDVFLPVEILQDCFGYLMIQDRKNLSLACNLFRSICLPSLFESVSYSLSISETTIRSRRQTQLGKAKDEIQRFKSSAESSIHAPLIRKCVMSDILMLDRGSSIDDEVAAAYASFTRAFAECVPYFINMKEVNMENFNAKIDKKVLAALASLTLLEKVIFRPIGFGVHVRLQELSILDGGSEPPLKLLGAISVESLEPLLDCTAICSIQLLQALIKQGSLERLHSLTVAIEFGYLHELYTFLALCPNVEHVQTTFDYEFFSFGTSLDPLPPSVIPRLKSFSGPDLAAKIFIPGRPVQKLHVKNEYLDGFDDAIQKWPLNMDIHLVFSSMSRSTSRVTDLNVETLQFAAENLIFSHPYLEKLTISLPQTTLFPEKDPQDIELPGSLTRSDEGVEVKNVIFGDAYEDPLDWGEKLRRGPEHFHRIHIHTVYMNILHWVAHRMLRLPSTIKTLFLEGEVHWSIFLFYEDQADEVNYVKKNGRPYSASMAQAVFRTLSKDYPALQSVAFGSSTDNRACFSWFRSDDGTWKYFPPLDYPLSFGGRIVKGHLEYGT